MVIFQTSLEKSFRIFIISQHLLKCVLQLDAIEKSRLNCSVIIVSSFGYNAETFKISPQFAL